MLGGYPGRRRPRRARTDFTPAGGEEPKACRVQPTPWWSVPPRVDGHREVVPATQTELTPDAPEKVDSPTDLDKRSWRYVVRKTAREFSSDQCTDLAAALTYYAVLALFPAAIALTSLVGLAAKGRRTSKTLLGFSTQSGEGPGTRRLGKP